MKTHRGHCISIAGAGSRRLTGIASPYISGTYAMVKLLSKILAQPLERVHGQAAQTAPDGSTMQYADPASANGDGL